MSEEKTLRLSIFKGSVGARRKWERVSGDEETERIGEHRPDECAGICKDW